MLLTPGLYLAEIDFSRTVAPDVLASGLHTMGWSEIAFDQGTLPSPLASSFTLRFVGRLERGINTLDTPFVHWSHVSAVPFDVLGGMRLSVYPFRLMTGGTYALWIMARMRSQEKRQDILKTLEGEGFQILKLSELKNNTRLPGRPGASVSFWYAIGVWTKPSSYVNTEYPFYFENVAEIRPAPQPAVHTEIP